MPLRRTPFAQKCTYERRMLATLNQSNPSLMQSTPVLTHSGIARWHLLRASPNITDCTEACAMHLNHRYMLQPLPCLIIRFKAGTATDDQHTFIVCSVMPAAIDTMVCLSSSCCRHSRSTVATYCGLTATKITSAFLTSCTGKRGHFVGTVAFLQCLQRQGFEEE